ncbi:unnamed protein product [Acanthoscelides obtectus]|nr:unnamed protein product [Acanthoscelides obtectus]CAK1657069.1 Exosome complex component RRP42 [Acanthoscelides obtectus]
MITWVLNKMKPQMASSPMNSHMASKKMLAKERTIKMISMDIGLPSSSANATPNFEGRGGEVLAAEISNCLSSAYCSSLSFDLTKLCILQGKKCWKLYVDILILECGGNLFDAISIAVKVALRNTQVPRVKCIDMDGNNVEISVCHDMFDCQRLNVENAPVMVTVCKIGDKCIVDPDVAEEQCSVGSVVVAVSGNRFSTVLQTGMGSLHPLTLVDCLKMGHKVGQKLDEAVKEVLKESLRGGDVGFIK